PPNSDVYCAGVLATTAAVATYLPGPDALTNGFSLGSDRATGLVQARGKFDALYTYNYPLTSDEVTADFLLYSLFMAPSTWVDITPAPYTNSASPVFNVVTGRGYL